MQQAEFEEYQKVRFQDQVDWYGAIAARNKQLYSVFQWGVIALSAVLPPLISILDDDKLKWIAIGISIVVAIGTAALKVFKYQENWISYRAVAEALKRENWYFRAGIGDYTQSRDRRRTFVERVESIMAAEQIQWVVTQSQTDDPAGDDDFSAGGDEYSPQS